MISGLDFDAPNLGFVAPGLDFVAPRLGIVAPGLEIVFMPQAVDRPLPLPPSPA
jgi:hypothetical protein